MSEVQYIQHPIHTQVMIPIGEEVWKDVPGYEGEYQVSNTGKVKSLRRSYIRKDGTIGRIRERILAGCVLSEKYKRVFVDLRGSKNKGRYYTAFLVLLVFIGSKPEGCEVSHLNGKEWDDRPENLCWETHFENNRRKRDHGTNGEGRDHMKGTSNPRAKLTDDQVREIRHLYDAKQFSQSQLGRKYEVHQTIISDIVRRVGWRHIT